MTNNHPVHLIVQYYRCAEPERQREIDTCLRNNLLNPYLAAIHLLTEELFDVSLFPNAEKIVQVVINERLTYQQAFRYANENDKAGRNVWVLSNADIYYDESLHFLSGANLDGVVYALSRHEVGRDGSIRFIDERYAHGSQDAWIFATPLNVSKMFTDFKLGVPGCDNRIAYEFIKSGYVVTNPAKTIKCYHLDLTKESNLEKRTSSYAELNDAGNIAAGKIAPPPYQFYIYPTDNLGLEHVDAYAGMQRKLLDLTDQESELKSLYTQLADICQHLAERDQYAAELDQRIVARDHELSTLHDQVVQLCGQVEERDRMIISIKNSISWKVTSPMRTVLDLCTKKRI